MSFETQADRLVVRENVEGSIFPRGESMVGLSVLVDAPADGKSLRIGRSIYGRSLTLRGSVRVEGPIVCRGDALLEPQGGTIRLRSGIVAGGSLSVEPGNSTQGLAADIRKAAVIVKGDISANQSVVLRDTIVFGSVRALHVRLENSLVLGTTIAEEQLVVAMSAMSGYLARDVTFEGACSMICAIGESSSRPVFVPHEGRDGALAAPDIRFYPGNRGRAGFMNGAAASPEKYPEESRLAPESDWVRVDAQRNVAVEGGEGTMDKWVLSLGGRIGNLGKVASSIDALTQMLKLGFESEHYAPPVKSARLAAILPILAPEEAWLLREVCD